MTAPFTNFPIPTVLGVSLTLPDQTISGGANVQPALVPAGNITIDCGLCPLQFQANNGAFTITAPAKDGSCIFLSQNGASAGTITFSGFSVSAFTGSSLDTINGHNFSIFIWRVNGVSAYQIVAHQ